MHKPTSTKVKAQRQPAQVRKASLVRPQGVVVSHFPKAKNAPLPIRTSRTTTARPAQQKQKSTAPKPLRVLIRSKHRVLINKLTRKAFQQGCQSRKEAVNTVCQYKKASFPLILNLVRTPIKRQVALSPARFTYRPVLWSGARPNSALKINARKAKEQLLFLVKRNKTKLAQKTIVRAKCASLRRWKQRKQTALVRARRLTALRGRANTSSDHYKHPRVIVYKALKMISN